MDNVQTRRREGRGKGTPIPGEGKPADSGTMHTDCRSLLRDSGSVLYGRRGQLSNAANCMAPSKPTSL